MGGRGGEVSLPSLSLLVAFSYNPSCVAGVWKGREREFLGARSARGGNKRKTPARKLLSFRSSPPPVPFSRAPRVSLAHKTRFPFPFKRLPRRLLATFSVETTDTQAILCCFFKHPGHFEKRDICLRLLRKLLSSLSVDSELSGGRAGCVRASESNARGTTTSLQFPTRLVSSIESCQASTRHTQEELLAAYYLRHCLSFIVRFLVCSSCIFFATLIPK